MDPRQMFEWGLPLVDDVVRRECRRVGLTAAEIDDLASAVRVALVENDYAILRRYEGRASLSTYLTIVVRRLLSRRRTRRDEARGRGTDIREVPLLPRQERLLTSAEHADTATIDRELHVSSVRTATLVAEAMARWPAEDRLLVRLRFEAALTVAEIARLMGVPQRPLYRRFASLLDKLRVALVAAGIDSSTASDLLSASDHIEMDFHDVWNSA